MLFLPINYDLLFVPFLRAGLPNGIWVACNLTKMLIVVFQISHFDCGETVQSR